MNDRDTFHITSRLRIIYTYIYIYKYVYVCTLILFRSHKGTFNHQNARTSLSPKYKTSPSSGGEGGGSGEESVTCDDDSKRHHLQFWRSKEAFEQWQSSTAARLKRDRLFKKIFLDNSKEKEEKEGGLYNTWRAEFLNFWNEVEGGKYHQPYEQEEGMVQAKKKRGVFKEKGVKKNICHTSKSCASGLCKMETKCT